mmetsp:Transcript_47086/g.73678  ORF Transcript_47086/g.73678 Transcript_47086/m.73678 type:complete len:89 (+) Transcript_47086:951-1217(+)
MLQRRNCKNGDWAVHSNVGEFSCCDTSARRAGQAGEEEILPGVVMLVATEILHVVQSFVPGSVENMSPRCTLFGDATTIHTPQGVVES